MKRLLLASIILSLMGCESESNSSNPFLTSTTTDISDGDDTKSPTEEEEEEMDVVDRSTNPNPDFPEDFTISIVTSVTSRNVRSLELSWDTLPSTYEYKLCTEDTSLEYDCNQLSDGDAGDDPVLNLQLGSTTAPIISLTQLLNNELFIVFTDSAADPDENYDNSFNLVFASEIVNSLIQYLKPSNTETGDLFGFSVSMSGDGKTIAVGSREQDNATDVLNDTDNLAGSGAVYLFTDTELGWQQQDFIKPPYPDRNDEFGKYVALSQDGTTLAVSVPGDDANSTIVDETVTISITDILGNVTVEEVTRGNNNLTDTGGVAIYTFANDTWSFSAMLKSKKVTDTLAEKDAQSCDFTEDEKDLTDECQAILADSIALENMQFGRNFISISQDGNTIAVGHYSGIEGSTSLTKDERVEIFVKDGSSWSHSQTINSPIPTEIDFFGYDLSFNQDASLLAISAISEDSSTINNSLNNAAQDSGSVYVYRLSGASYSLEKYLKPDSPVAAQEFGSSLEFSLDGSKLAVGAPGNRTVYIFEENGGAWTEYHQIESPNGETDENFGHNLALNDDATKLMIADADRNKTSGIFKDSTSLTSNVSSFTIGSVHVYDITENPAIEEAYIKPLSKIVLFPMFGFSIATNVELGNIDIEENYNSIDIDSQGSVLVVGSPGDDSNATGLNGNPDPVTGFNSKSGAVYIYHF